MERNLASIETISEISPIPDADSIVRARIRGWDVVVKVGEFQVGDPCVYFEIDSMLDTTDERFSFLAPRGVRTDVSGRTGHVLKTVRLRGQCSQGLALPVNDFPEIKTLPIGSDVTEVLGVVRWEPAIPASLSGLVRGIRPSWIPKTDEERIQNIPELLDCFHILWTATEKIDGSSATFWVNKDDQGVCSRNLDLTETPNNTLWNLAHQHDVFEQLRNSGLGDRAAVQGEIFGEGVQGNPLKQRGQHFAAFTVLSNSSPMPRGSWPRWIRELSVPILRLAFPHNSDEALSQADNLASMINPDRAAEGIVWRGLDYNTVTLKDGRSERASFKVISNRYLLKHDR